MRALTKAEIKLRHETAQMIVWVGLGAMTVVECMFYGVPVLLAAPALVINSLWVWE